MIAFLGRRAAALLRRRYRLVSRAFLVIGAVKWLSRRGQRSAVITVPRDGTLVVTAQRGETR